MSRELLLFTKAGISREREDKKVGHFWCIIVCLAITVVGWEAFGKEQACFYSDNAFFESG